MYVGTVQVQHRQLGVTRSLGVKLVMYTPVIYICAGKSGLMTLTFGGRSTAHAPVIARSELAPFHTRLNHNRYITPPRLLVPGSKGLYKIRLWETKIKNSTRK